MTHYQLYAFSTYWVFTIITTVGYGDYTAGTTLEYQLTMFLMLFGVLVFSLIQISVTRVVNSKYHFKHYIEERAREIDFWLITMEKSCFPYYMPGAMCKLLRETANETIGNDFNMIIEEYGFWEKCTAKD